MCACKRMLSLSLVLCVGPLAGMVDAVEKTEGGSRVIRVAAISFVPVKFDLRANASRLEAMFRQARRGRSEERV